MCFWKHKVAVVTDSESVLGLNIIKSLTKCDMIIIGFCKSVPGLNNVREKLKSMGVDWTIKEVILYTCEVTNVNQIKAIFEEINEKYEAPSVLINNAFCNIDCCVSEGAIRDVKTIIDTNVNAVVTCTRLVAGQIIERNCRGHIIFITDVTNQIIMHSNMFTASMSAVKSINGILKQEFRYINANIKVTNIVYKNAQNAEGLISKDPGKEITEMVKFVLNTPEHLQVHEMLLELE